MRIGLTFDEYVELWLKPPAGANRLFHQAAEEEAERMFPMTTVQATSHLRSRGDACCALMLDLLVENQVVKLAQPDVWTQADVDAAADHFEEAGVLVPYGETIGTLTVGSATIPFYKTTRRAVAKVEFMPFRSPADRIDDAADPSRRLDHPTG